MKCRNDKSVSPGIAPCLMLHLLQEMVEGYVPGSGLLNSEPTAFALEKLLALFSWRLTEVPLLD